MRLVALVLIACALLGSVAGPAAARAVTQDERSALRERIASLRAAFADEDWAAMVGFVPPGVLALLAEESGWSDARIRQGVAGVIMRLARQVEFEGLEINVDGAQERVLPNGTPYLLLPTTLVVRAPDLGMVEVAGFTLALLDEGRWYLARLDQAQHLRLLRRAYPAFEGETFPSGTVRAVD